MDLNAVAIFQAEPGDRRSFKRDFRFASTQSRGAGCHIPGSGNISGGQSRNSNPPADLNKDFVQREKQRFPIELFPEFECRI